MFPDLHLFPSVVAKITDRQYFTIAGPILIVGSRHSSYIRAALEESPIPKPFSVPLDSNQMYSLASQFITRLATRDTILSLRVFPSLIAKPTQDLYIAGDSPITFRKVMSMPSLKVSSNQRRYRPMLLFYVTQ